MFHVMNALAEEGKTLFLQGFDHDPALNNPLLKCTYEIFRVRFCFVIIRGCIIASERNLGVNKRVSSDLENLEMSVNFDARIKSQGISKKQEKSWKSQGILLCKIHFQPI